VLGNGKKFAPLGPYLCSCKGKDPLKTVGESLVNILKVNNEEGREEPPSTTYLWGNP